MPRLPAHTITAQFFVPWVVSSILPIESLLIANLVLVAIQPNQGSVQRRCTAGRAVAVLELSSCAANPARVVISGQGSAKLCAPHNLGKVNETDLLRSASDGNQRHTQHDQTAHETDCIAQFFA